MGTWKLRFILRLRLCLFGSRKVRVVCVRDCYLLGRLNRLTVCNCGSSTFQSLQFLTRFSRTSLSLKKVIVLHEAWITNLMNVLSWYNQCRGSINQHMANIEKELILHAYAWSTVNPNQANNFKAIGIERGDLKFLTNKFFKLLEVINFQKSSFGTRKLPYSPSLITGDLTFVMKLFSCCLQSFN